MAGSEQQQRGAGVEAPPTDPAPVATSSRPAAAFFEDLELEDLEEQLETPGPHRIVLELAEPVRDARQVALFLKRIGRIVGLKVRRVDWQ